MAPRRPRDIGTAAETAVVRYLRNHGFPHAERRALRGARDAGDITGTPGICWSVKGGQMAKDAGDGLVEDWLSDLDKQTHHAGADHGILVTQRRGYGPDRAGKWWAITRLDGFVPIAAHTASTHQPDLSRAPVRVHLADMCQLLRHAGYGTEVQP